MYIGSDLFLPVVKQPKGIAVAEVLELGRHVGVQYGEKHGSREDKGETLISCCLS